MIRRISLLVGELACAGRSFVEVMGKGAAARCSSAVPLVLRRWGLGSESGSRSLRLRRPNDRGSPGVSAAASFASLAREKLGGRERRAPASASRRRSSSSSSGGGSSVGPREHATPPPPPPPPQWLPRAGLPRHLLPQWRPGCQERRSGHNSSRRRRSSCTHAHLHPRRRLGRWITPHAAGHHSSHHNARRSPHRPCSALAAP